MQYSKKDLWLSLVSGLFTGVIAWRLVGFLGVPRYFGLSHAWLVLVIPALWLFGVWLGYFLGRWFGFFSQFGKYVAIGFLNFAIDIGILNFLIYLSGKALGISFSIFKVLAFSIAVTNSYLWNKYWSFEAGKSGGGKQEAVKFLGVNLVALAVNVGVASFVANGIGPQFSFTDKSWASISAVAGSAAALLITFVSLRLFVFKKDEYRALPKISS